MESFGPGTLRGMVAKSKPGAVPLSAYEMTKNTVLLTNYTLGLGQITDHKTLNSAWLPALPAGTAVSDAGYGHDTAALHCGFPLLARPIAACE